MEADASSTLPLIRCFDAAYDPATGAAHFLLEDLSTTHSGHAPSHLPPRQADAERIVDALALLHASGWDTQPLRATPGLAGYDALASTLAGPSHAARAFDAFAAFLDDRLSSERRAVYELVFARLPSLLTRRMSEGTRLALTHGDPHIGNFLYPRDPRATGHDSYAALAASLPLPPPIQCPGYAAMIRV